MNIKTLLKGYLFIPLICLQLLTGCKNTKSIASINQEPEKINAFTIVGASEIKVGSVAYFEVINNTNSPITIYSPWLKRIEKFENNSWRKVKIISCPCGADCNAPPKTLTLNPSEKHKYDWNLKEGWCGKQLQNGIPETIENNSEIGLYRISIDYGTEKDKKTIIKEFKIIK
ncbi:MAG TPA: hypothetical protein DIW31_08385 [Bacteroidales bacterium]|nr:hypothetical protein [Bacteroidales bacterium]